MRSSIRMAGVICLMAVMAAMFSSCASQKLGCPMKISKAPVTEKSKNC